MNRFKPIYHKISVLLVCKILGIANSQEENAIEQWEKEMGQKIDYDTLKQSIKQRSTKTYYQETHINTSWDQIRKQLKAPSKHRAIRHYLGYTALIFLALGIGLVLLNDRTNTSSLIETSQYHIEPGMAHAILTLSNGKQIALNGSKEEQILCEGGILNQQKSNLRYDSIPLNLEKEIFNTITVPRGGEFSLELSDGTKIWLNTESQITYPVKFIGQKRKVKLTGEAYFEVNKDKEHPFIVETEEIAIQVLGTSFNIHAYADERKVITTLVEGKVQINNQQHILGILKASEQGIWDKTQKEYAQQQVNPSVYIQWLHGDFCFRGENLENIMKTLQRWYDMEYTFQDPDLKEIQFYGTLNRYENIQELLNQFEKTGKVHFEYHQKQIMIRTGQSK